MSCLSLDSVLNTNVQGLRSMELKNALKWGSEVVLMFLLCVCRRLCFFNFHRTKEPCHLLSVVTNELWREQGKVTVLVDHIITLLLGIAS